METNPIHPLSIYAHGESRFKFRYQYLDEFKNDEVLASKLDLCEFHDLKSVGDALFDIQKAFNHGRTRAMKEAKKTAHIYPRRTELSLFVCRESSRRGGSFKDDHRGV